MHLNKTKKNHYVPQLYLKAFKDNNGNIFVWSKSKNNIQLIRNLEKIAYTKNLYTIESKISENDKEVFKKMYKISPDNFMANIVLDYLVYFLNDELANIVAKFESKSGEHNELVAEYEKKFRDSINETISRNQELLFGLYENDFNPLLQDILRTENISFSKTEESLPMYFATKLTAFVFEMFGRKISMLHANDSPEIKAEFKSIVDKTREEFSPNPYYDFTHYILTQYFRTPKVLRSNLLFPELNAILQKHNIKFDSILILIIHYQLVALLHVLIEDQYKLVLIKNKTNTPFITSDNPAVNTYAGVVKNRAFKENEFEIYFPLSPKLAILFSNQYINPNMQEDSNEAEIESEKQIEYWNKLIFDGSLSYVYSDSKALLEKMTTRL